MNLLSPGIALLKPLSGRIRFWVLPTPLLLVIFAFFVQYVLGGAVPANEGSLIFITTLIGMPVWLYLQLAFFSITPDYDLDLMQPGQFNKRCAFQHEARSADGAGGYALTWTDDFTCWGFTC